MDKGDFVERIIPDRAEYALWQEHINRYVFVLGSCPNKVVLDVACGVGYGTELISKTTDLVVGVDISREALMYARENYGKQRNTAFVLSDAYNLPFRGDVFDTVVSFETIEHLAHSGIFLQEIARVLKMSGKLIVSTPNGQISSPKQKRLSNPFHLKEFDFKEFSQLLSVSFTNLQFYGQNCYTIKDWLLRFLDEHFPFSFRIQFRKLNKLLSKPLMPKKGVTKIVDPLYRVKKLTNIYPIYSPQFLIAIVKNRARSNVNS